MTKLSLDQILIVRYLRGLGLQQADIAQYMGVSRQVIAYQLKLLRRASIKEGSLPGLKQAGGISPLVGYDSTPCPPSSECDWCNTEPNAPDREANHSCPIYVRHAAYAQLEDLPKYQKIAVIIKLLGEVELE
jgi:hypothetical protein